jgi:hypothetical protein
MKKKHKNWNADFLCQHTIVWDVKGWNWVASNLVVAGSTPGDSNYYFQSNAYFNTFAETKVVKTI